MSRGHEGLFVAVVFVLAGCGEPDHPESSYPEVTTAHCQYAPVPATANAGGAVVAGPLHAGAAEVYLEVPVSTALGSYTARANFLGGAGRVDERHTEINGKFSPSIGVETRPKVKALALTAGGETVVILKADVGFPYEGYTFELEQRLGAELDGKVLITASHSHSSWGQFSDHDGIGGIGAGQVQELVHDNFLDGLEAAAREALDARQPARIGVAVDTNFDPDGRVTRDRRNENDAMSGGPRDDNMLFMVRVEATSGAPIAALPIFGIHGTLQDDDNSFASTDAVGGVERMLEEQFDEPVVVIHLQGAGGDVSPVGHGRVDCDVKPGSPDDPCWQWLTAEGLGREALPLMLAAWDAAGQQLRESIELEMMTRSVELGPWPETFAIRDGALSYAQFDRYTEADRRIWDGDGNLLSPIDEFNAPVGAALCEEDDPVFPAGQMTGVDDLVPYGSCVTVDVAGPILGELLSLRFASDVDKPVCQSTRTTVSALRIGEYMVGTMPGEVTTLIADYVRERSPFAGEKTIVLGYAQGEMGYILTPEDWLQGGYESSINFWGPLEGEYLAEQTIALMAMAATPEREDAGSTGADRHVTSALQNDFTIADLALAPGVIPSAAQLGDAVWTRTGMATRAQPAATIERVRGLARFVWVGDHPARGTPLVTLQREVGPGAFEDVERRSGRRVTDHDVLLSYNQLPLRPEPSEALTHIWVAEWQAVPWIGSGGLDELSARAGVPLGKYRFHVAGPGYSVSSDPFEVVPATLSLAVAVANSVVTVTVSVHASKGYRLLDMELPSNRPVPVRDGTFAVTLTLSGGGSLVFEKVSADSAGTIVVDVGVADVVAVSVTDSYGNSGVAEL